jgi:hypothetical protein
MLFRHLTHGLEHTQEQHIHILNKKILFLINRSNQNQPRTWSQGNRNGRVLTDTYLKIVIHKVPGKRITVYNTLGTLGVVFVIGWVIVRRLGDAGLTARLAGGLLFKKRIVGI